MLIYMCNNIHVYKQGCVMILVYTVRECWCKLGWVTDNAK